MKVIHCENCDIPIAIKTGDRWEWIESGAGVSEISEKELCGSCLSKEKGSCGQEEKRCFQ